MLEIITSRRFFYPAVTILVLILLSGVGYYTYDNYYSNEQSNSQESSSPSQPEHTKNTDSQQTSTQKTIRLIAAGDFLPHDTVNQQAKTSDDYDYLQFMQSFKPYFEKAQASFCVQAVPAGGEKFGISGYPVFNAPTAFTRDMVDLGCDVVSSGTNHTNDKGQPLINENLKVWDKYKEVLVAGSNRSPEEQNKVRTFNVGDVKFIFLSYSTYTNKPVTNNYGLNMFNATRAKADLKAAREKADIVLVSMRWGTEYSPGINPKQAELAKFLSDNGADIVFGHGQHVQGPVKKLKQPNGDETVVWYGIGNFINTQLEVETLFNGIPVMDIDTQTKKITNLSFLPFYMHYEWTAQQKATNDLLKRTNLGMYTFHKAKPLIKKAQHDTTVAAQEKRLKDVLNQYTEVKILKPEQY